MNATASNTSRKKRIYCPWLWLLGLVLVALTVLWAEERKRLMTLAESAVKAVTMGDLIEDTFKSGSEPDQFERRLLLSQLGLPSLTDPFGNFIYLRSKWLGNRSIGGSPVTSTLGIYVMTFNRDRSLCRTAGLDSEQGFAQMAYKVTDGDIPPALASAALLVLTALWLRWEWRNRKRARKAIELAEVSTAGHEATGK